MTNHFLLLLILSLFVHCQSFLHSFQTTPPTCSFKYPKQCMPGLSNQQKNIFSSFGNGDASDLKADEEEVLMRVSLSVCNTCSVDDTVQLIQNYLQSFPFSAVLPVQPLSYLPKEDGMGVSVSFLRKKTQEKSSYDGGIDFTIQLDDTDEDQGSRVDIVARRNSQGQYISKMFSEKMIVKAFVNGLNYGENNQIGARVGLGYDELLETCSVESIFHKWM